MCLNTGPELHQDVSTLYTSLQMEWNVIGWNDMEGINSNSKVGEYVLEKNKKNWKIQM
jgi:hypothetical protein